MNKAFQKINTIKQILNDGLKPSKFYSFGSLIKDRVWSPTSTGNYRFGFNTQEKDNELYGEGNAMTAEYWEYDTRLGRRWNLDPKPVVGISQYTCFESNPIMYMDPDGQFVVEARNRDERRNMRIIIVSMFREALSWNKSEWRNVLDISGYNTKWQYLKNFIPGCGPTIRFSSQGINSDGPAKGDGMGNPINPNNPNGRSAYATTAPKGVQTPGAAPGTLTPTGSTITLDEGLNRLLNDIRSSRRNNQLEGVMASGGATRNRNLGQFLRFELNQTKSFAITVLGHELSHHGAWMNSLPDNSTMTERGDMFERAIYGSVRGHLDFGYAVYSTFQARLWSPNSGNNSILNAQRRGFVNPALFGPGF